MTNALAASHVHTLGTLLADLPVEIPAEPCVITGLALDSRVVKPGDCFFALRGRHADGAQFAMEACARGARAIVTDSADLRGQGVVPVMHLPDLREQLGRIAARFHGNPTCEMPVIAVTGTNGKTTVAHLCAQALGFVGKPGGYIGTLGSGILPTLVPGEMTTPDPLSLQARLADLRDRGCAVVALEASSHALAQSRLAGTRVDTAIFTGLGHDHLDYHASIEDYFAAKARLFTLSGLRHAVLNMDDPWSTRIAEALASNVTLTVFGTGAHRIRGAGSEIRLVKADYGMQSTHLEVAIDYDRLSFDTPLQGEFNACNLLAVLAALLGLGIRSTVAVDALSRVRAVRGRMERFGGRDGEPLVFVDYAHSPDSLERVLRSLRALGPARMHCVFGCGGNRDRSKRPRMGEIAARLADTVIVTSDNPRDEAPSAIAQEILAAMPDRSRVRVVLDRDEAIVAALSAAGPGDIVLIAGKGHETTQEACGMRTAQSDQATVERWLRETK